MNQSSEENDGGEAARKEKMYSPVPSARGMRAKSRLKVDKTSVEGAEEVVCFQR